MPALISYDTESNTPTLFMLQKPELSAGTVMSHMAPLIIKITINFTLKPYCQKFNAKSRIYAISGKDLHPFTPKSAKFKSEQTILNFLLQNCKKQTVPHENTAQ